MRAGPEIIELPELVIFLRKCIHQPAFNLHFQGGILMFSSRNQNGRFEIQSGKRKELLGPSGDKKAEFDSIEDTIEYYSGNDLFDRPPSNLGCWLM